MSTRFVPDLPRSVFTAPAVWETTPRGIAAQLRRAIHIESARVLTRGTSIEIIWVDGPATPPTKRDLLGQMPFEHVNVWTRRVYSPPVFGAALLDPHLKGTRDWARISAALRHLENRDLDTNPMPVSELDLGRHLAQLADVPANAEVICRGRNRYDYAMVRELEYDLDLALRAALEG